MAQLIKHVEVVTDVEPDSIAGRARELRLQAKEFVCADNGTYEAAIEALQSIKRQRRQWKDQHARTITLAKAAWEEARRSWSSVDGELEAAYDAIKEECERFIDRRRVEQAAALKAASDALERTPQRVDEHLSQAFDAAVAAGDTAQAERVLAQAETAGEEVYIEPPIGDIMPEESFVPKVEGASTAVPYTWELLDQNKLPPEFVIVTPDRKKITALVRAMRADAQKILGPGVLVRPDTTLRIRER